MTLKYNAGPRATNKVERPVHVLSADRKLAESVALELRHHGLRVRTFVNAEVLRNAVRAELPLAVVMDVAYAKMCVELRTMRKPDDKPPALLFLGDDTFELRLRAVRAGGVGYFPIPVNRSALLHHLTSLMSAVDDGTNQILIVDGRLAALASVAQALDAAGFQSHVIQEPRRVLDELERGSFRLIVLNDELDGMRGTDALQVVRQSLRFHALPAIILTSDDKRRLSDEASAAGTDALLSLPIAPTDLVSVVRSELQRADRLRHAYQYSIRRDPASGLFNRHHFLEVLRQAVRDAATGHGRAALLWLNVKPATQTSAADGASGTLMEVANLLSRHLPPLALTARMDACAVAILLPDPGSGLENLLSLLADRLQPLLGGYPNIGATLLTGRQRSATEALELAQVSAKLRSTRAGKALHKQTQSATSNRWFEELRDALDENRLRLVYQPIASLRGEPTSYYEVFVRMVTDDQRDILAQEFLGAVEAGGLTERLDRWVLSRAVRILESQRVLRDEPTLFVKLFPDTVDSGVELVRWLRDLVQVAGLRPDRLVLQIKQECAAARMTQTQRFADAAREFGARLAVEQFAATGRSAQQLLQALRPDFVRLSPGLTQDIGTNLEHQRLVEGISGQCRAVGAKPIATLVQDALNLSALWRCGIEYIQGNFMQEPIDIFSDGEQATGG